MLVPTEQAVEISQRGSFFWVCHKLSIRPCGALVIGLAESGNHLFSFYFF